MYNQRQQCILTGSPVVALNLERIQGLQNPTTSGSSPTVLRQPPLPAMQLSVSAVFEHSQAKLWLGVQATVWTLRFTTGQARGSGLDGTGVQLCLVGQSGDAVLHRISASHDATAARQDLLTMCKVYCAFQLCRLRLQPFSHIETAGTISYKAQCTCT